ncbi:MAG: hypothetical protein U5K69_29780 [Balneolaceae bacterium]|nr:hypothetical protein [Balneolaceae bacterium]
MKKTAYNLLGSLFVLLLATGCAKQPETIVIDNEPESPAEFGQKDTTVTSTDDADFKQLIVGEIDPDYNPGSPFCR